MRFQIHVTPRSRVNEIQASKDGGGAIAIRVRVTAPPDQGAANEAVLSLLRRKLGLDARSIRIAGGAVSRRKWVEADGLDEAELWRRLKGPK
jgi:uncharacterized protein YggU (UPF0235/DUF167 family)